MSKSSREEGSWLDDAFDENKAKAELERAQGGSTKAAGCGCVVVVVALICLLAFTLVSGVGILSSL